MIESLISALKKEKAYQELNAYYGQATPFSILRIERNENRHSSFIQWLLNPSSSHSLSDTPLRDFLSMVATKADSQEKCFYPQVRERLITGDYELEVMDAGVERSIVSLLGGKSHDAKPYLESTGKGEISTGSANRFDIWMLIKISFLGKDDIAENWTIPLVIENKIYSKEGGAKDPKKAQTVRYHRIISMLKSQLCSDNYYQPLLVYLSPEGADFPTPTSPSFVKISYQDLVDNVIQPAEYLATCKGSEFVYMLNGYIRNLSCPSDKENGQGTDYSILAISPDEKALLEKIYESETFKVVLCALYEKEAKALLGTDFIGYDEDLSFAEQFWNANESLFKVVIYNHFRNDPEAMKIVRKIVKVSNRDNSKYMVADHKGRWLNSKPASKSETSYLISKALCILLHDQHKGSLVTAEELNSHFDGSLNEYYRSRFLMNLFYDIDQPITYDVPGTKAFGNSLDINNTWDFYTDKKHSLPFVSGNVRGVKMWRKADFERLIEKTKSFGIIVEKYDDQ